jgi:hypothetical protein
MIPFIGGGRRSTAVGASLLLANSLYCQLAIAPRKGSYYADVSFAFA